MSTDAIDAIGIERPDAQDGPDQLLLVFLYLLECAAVVLALGLNKKGASPLLPFLATRAGGFSVIALMTCLASAWVVIRQFRRRQPRARRFALTVTLNVISVLATTILAEPAIRALTVQTVAGPMVAGTGLMPRSWETVARRQHEVWQRSARGPSGTPYFVYDDVLGWTVGSSRRSPDGLYASSAEGIRSADPSVSYRGRHPRHRVAIVGDSYTFGAEVTYEDSWGHRLERDLGPDVDVLNFGVEAYGLDQTYLRYMRDIRAWHPDVVIFGLINHDMERAMAVYTFVSFPEWSLPFAKPRFIMTSGGLRVLNLPLPSPDAIFARRSIAELPYIKYDRGYNAADWQWHWYHYSFLGRFLLSRYPRWPVPGPLVSDDAKRTINREVVLSMMRAAREEASVPIVAYFPARSELVSPDQRFDGWRFARNLLDAEGVPYVDLTPCVTEVPPSERWMKIHYSPRTNAAVARCLRQLVLAHLGAEGRASRSGDALRKLPDSKRTYGEHDASSRHRS